MSRNDIAVQDIRSLLNLSRLELSETFAVLEGCHDELFDTPEDRDASMRRHIARALSALNAAQGELDAMVRKSMQAEQAAPAPH